MILWQTRKSLFSNVKEKLTKELQCDLLYKFLCECGSMYIGNTGQQLSKRMTQHCPKWVLGGTKSMPKSNKEPASAITKHIMGCQEYTGSASEHFSIMAHEQSYPQRLILEALYIKFNSPNLCVQKDITFNLNIQWS